MTMPDKTPEELEAERVAAQQLATPEPSTKDVLAAYNSVIAEKDRALRDALADAARLRAEANKEPDLTPEQSAKQFFENPVELIRSEIQRAIAPINQSISTFTQQNQYAQLKIQMKQDPRFADLDKIEKEFDQMMQGQAITPDIMIGAYYAAYGMVAKTDASRLIATTVTPAEKPPVKPETLPPHLRPSAPPAPVTQTPSTKRPPLTENERLLMRINGIKSEDEWYALMDAKPTDIIKVEAK